MKTRVRSPVLVCQLAQSAERGALDAEVLGSTPRLAMLPGEIGITRAFGTRVLGSIPRGAIQVAPEAGHSGIARDSLKWGRPNPAIWAFSSFRRAPVLQTGGGRSIADKVHYTPA